MEGVEDRDTKQGMVMELPSEAKTGPECGMFTWRDWTSSAIKKKDNSESQYFLTHISFSLPDTTARIMCMCVKN